jgi:uncharacterized protein YcbK (DUF882 family)
MAAGEAGFRGGSTGPLTLRALHLDEELQLTPFRPDGTPDPVAFEALRDLFRCRHTDHRQDLDPALVDLLVRLSERFDGASIGLVSGHRSAGVPDTRPTSRHVSGRAADIKIRGVGLRRLQRAARELGAGGVGLYPGDGFVHVDIRDKHYEWTQAPSSSPDEVSLAAPMAQAEDQASPSEPEAAGRTASTRPEAAASNRASAHGASYGASDSRPKSS